MRKLILRVKGLFLMAAERFIEGYRMGMAAFVVWANRQTANLVSSNVGAVNIQVVMSSLIIAFVALLFVINVTPTIETEITSANITNTFTSSMIDMASWLLPVGGIVAVFYGIFTMFRNRGNGGA